MRSSSELADSGAILPRIFGAVHAVLVTSAYIEARDVFPAILEASD